MGYPTSLSCIHTSPIASTKAPEHELPIEEGQIFGVDGATVRAVHGPGHSHNHICFFLEEENTMFMGDIVLGRGTSAIEQLGLYMETPRKLQSQECKIGDPVHGAIIPDINSEIATELAQKARRENITVLKVWGGPGRRGRRDG